MGRGGPPVLDLNDSTSAPGGRPLHCGISNPAHVGLGSKAEAPFFDRYVSFRRLRTCRFVEVGPPCADIVAKVPNGAALIFLLQKIRPTTADRCGLNHVTEVASEFIFTQ